MAGDRVSTPYFRAVDPFPLESPDHTKLHEFYARLAEGRLVTTRCSGCGTRSWPPRGFCAECASDTFEWVDVPGEGTIHAFTIQETGLPAGFESPRIFTIVKVEDLRIFAVLRNTSPDAVNIGQRVRLSPLRVTDDPKGNPRWLTAFEPAP